MHKYEVVICWSGRGGVFVAEVPELGGCCAHGDTKQAALDRVESAIGLWGGTAREFGDRVPEPESERLMPAQALRRGGRRRGQGRLRRRDNDRARPRRAPPPHSHPWGWRFNQAGPMAPDLPARSGSRPKGHLSGRTVSENLATSLE